MRNLFRKIETISKSLGYTSPDFSNKGLQDEIQTHYNSDNETITVYGNIDNPSIYLDTPNVNTLFSFEEKAKEVLNEYFYTISTSLSTYEFDMDKFRQQTSKGNN